MLSKYNFNLTPKSFFIAIASIFINFLMKYVCELLSLPMWADSLGTVIASYCLGPVWGVITGVSLNVLYAVKDITSLPYAVSSVVIALIVAHAGRKGAFNRLVHAMSIAGIITILCGAISAVTSLVMFGGGIGNIWGDGVKDFLMEAGAPLWLSCFIGQFYIDFLDKTVTITLLYLTIRIYRWMRDNDRLPGRKNTAAAGLILILFFAFGAAPVSGSVVTASGNNKAYGKMKAESDPTSFNYVQTVYTNNSGLPCGHANDMAQTKNGLLWIGTYAGLYRCDGRSFKIMDHYDPIKNVNCLYTDEDDRLWVGTNDNGLSVIKDETLLASMDSTGDLASDSVRSITRCSDGKYYVGTSDSLQILTFDEKNNKLELVDSLPDPGYAFSMDADENGYVAAVSGDCRLSILKDGKVLGTKSIDPEGGFNCVRFLSDGTLVCGTVSGKIIRYKLENGSLSKKSEAKCGKLNTINDIYEYNRDQLFICADNGIGRVAGKNDYHKLVTGDFSTAIENMEVDFQGNIWFVSSRQGVMKLSDTSFNNLFRLCGLKESVVNTTELWHGLLYVGTDNGLIVINKDDHSVIQNELTGRLKDVRIRCISKDSHGNLWISTYGAGLLRVSENGSVKNFLTELGDRVRVSIELSDGRIAVCGDNGLSYIKNDSVQKTIPYGKKLGESKILCMYEDEDGKLLAGTDGNGIVVLNHDKVESVIHRSYGLSSGVILRIVDDPLSDGIFVVCSNGLNYVTKDKVKYLKNFPYSDNFDIYINDEGSMFVLSSSGIYSMARSELMKKATPEYRLLDAINGLEGTLTSNAYSTIDDDHNLYLCTDRGVFVMNTENYLPANTPYKVFVEQLNLDGKPQTSFKNRSWRVPREVHRIEIFPEIVNYTLEDPTLVYWLEGFDNSKSYCRQSELTSVVYRNLPPGEYTFHMAVKDNTSKKMKALNKLSITREKAIYDNWWFMVYFWFVPILFVGWITWYITEYHTERTLEIAQNRLELANARVQMGTEAILAIAKTLDLKDGRTNRHSQRVSEYSVMIAREYGFEGDELENLRKAALLHDIGKIGIPDAILNKPDRLTDEEYAIMKSHVTKGAEILKDFTMVDHVEEGARYHHERYDGKGYPDGLKGTDIPLYGRIIAVADTFDAMTANRVYRKGLDLDYVIEELKRCRGTQFDPELCDIFLNLIESGKVDLGEILGVDKS